MPSTISWPSPADFAMSMQDPHFAFLDQRLREIEVARDKHGQPLVWAGAFAAVFKAKYPGSNETLAVRVFTSPSTERPARYRTIRKYLDSCRPPTSLMGFAYDDRGIRSSRDGKMYPLVTMEWVAGDTLFDWARRKCLDRDSGALRHVSDLWVDLIKELNDARIAHGDLQHANVMVTGNGKPTLKLVDYDCMCVPELVGHPNLEIGVEPYQHPGRCSNTLLSLGLDNFSALFILVAIKALAADPGLWKTYVEERLYEKLLFKREDLQNPTDSSLMTKLARSPDESVHRLSRALVELMNSKMEDVPSLRDVLFSFSEVRVLLDKRDFDGAIAMLERGGKEIADAPGQQLQSRLRNAKERIALLARLESAVEDADEGLMVDLYDPALLDDYPKAEDAVVEAKKAPRVIPLLKELKRVGQDRSWRDFVRIWDANRALLEKRKSARRFAGEIGKARERNQLCDDILRLVKRSPCDADALENAWNQLVRLGGHPDTDGEENSIKHLIERERAWTKFAKVPREDSEACDNQLVGAWNEQLFAGWDQAKRQRPRVESAEARLTAVQKLTWQVEQLASTIALAGETAVVKLAAKIPDGYTYKLQPRVELAKNRLQAYQQLQDALREPAYDLKIVEAWQELKQQRGQSLVPAKWSARIKLAEKRIPVLKLLAGIPKDYPVQEAHRYDPKLLAAWNDQLLRDCHDAEPWLETYGFAELRNSLLEELAAAIKALNTARIVELIRHPLLNGYQFPSSWGPVIVRAVGDRRAIRDLVAALNENDRVKFSRVFDARVIRRNGTELLPYKRQLLEWIESEILPLKKSKLGHSQANPKGVEKVPGSIRAYRVYWGWPDRRHSNECILTVSRSRPTGKENPIKLKPVSQPVSHDDYEDGGGHYQINIRDAWRGHYVTIWGVVDLGREFCSEKPCIGPLILRSPLR